MLKTRKSFTLIELIIVITIIGILATLGLSGLSTMREKSFDSEAMANLKLLQAAEKIYRMDEGRYYDGSTTQNLNSTLRLDLEGRNWSYSAGWSSNDQLCARATRNTPPAGWNRNYRIGFPNAASYPAGEACCCPRGSSQCPDQYECASCGSCP